MQAIDESDFSLIRAVQAGQGAAFNRLLLKYQSKVLNLLFSQIRDRTECLDLCQEVFLKTYKAIPKFKYQSSFYTWLYKITINTARSHLSNRNRKNTEVNLERLEERHYASKSASAYARAMHDSLDNSIESVELKHTLNLALNALPLELKNVIIFREIDGLSYEEIAEVSTCPIGTVRSRISRARAALEKQLKSI